MIPFAQSFVNTNCYILSVTDVQVSMIFNKTTNAYSTTVCSVSEIAKIVRKRDSISLDSVQKR